MGWVIASTSTSEHVRVINEPSVSHVIAVEAYDTQAGIRLRGDMYPEAAPLEIEVATHSGSYGDALDWLRRVVSIAKTPGARLEYTDGGETISRTFGGLAAYRATRLHPPLGILIIKLTMLPTGPYWRSSIRGDVIWAW